MTLRSATMSFHGALAIEGLIIFIFSLAILFALAALAPISMRSADAFSAVTES